MFNTLLAPSRTAILNKVTASLSRPISERRSRFPFIALSYKTCKSELVSVHIKIWYYYNCNYTSKACFVNMKLIFARHGETKSGREKRLEGSSDSPLTENGRRQAERLGFFCQENGVQ